MINRAADVQNMSGQHRRRQTEGSYTINNDRGLQASFRVQSERSERLRELTPAARRSRSLLIDRCGTPPQADGRSVYNKYRARLTKHPYECRVSGAAECLRCQFAGVAPLRSALHSNRTFITRGLYLLTGAALLAGNCAAVNVELNESGVRN